MITNMPNQERSFKGIWIPKAIWLAKDLTMQEKLFLVEIDSLDNESGCTANNTYFAEFFDLSKDRVSRIISSLAEKKSISVEIKKTGPNRSRRIITMLDLRYRRKRQGGIVENANTGIGGNTKHNNTEISNTVNNPENGAFSDKDRSELIDLFKEVNPSYRILFSRKNQGEAIKRLLEQYGRQELEKIIRFLPKIISVKYAPRITTPIQLEEKMGELIAFVRQQREKQNKTSISFAL